MAPKKGMVLPFQPLAIAFHNLNYYVDMPAVCVPLKDRSLSGDNNALAWCWVSFESTSYANSLNWN